MDSAKSPYLVDILLDKEDEKDKHLLCCSHGHVYNPNSRMDTWWKGLRTEGGNCPEIMSYDRMNGTKKCQRKLFNLLQKVDELYEKSLTKRYGGNDDIFSTHCRELLPNSAKESKKLIKRLLKEKINVKTGYTASSIRGSHWHHVFYQNK